MLSVLLVDQHVALRECMGAILEDMAVEVVGSAGSAGEAIDLLQRCQPDVVVVGLCLPDRGGLSLVREIRASPSKAKILIYTASQDGETLANALQSGAEGIILKPGGMKSFMNGLWAVAHGDRHVDPAILAILAAASECPHVLTKREREVFGLLAAGLSGELIAAHLVLSPNTVRTHVRNGMEKLHAKTRTEAVVMALEDGEIVAEHQVHDQGSVS